MLRGSITKCSSNCGESSTAKSCSNQYPIWILSRIIQRRLSPFIIAWKTPNLNGKFNFIYQTQTVIFRSVFTLFIILLVFLLFCCYFSLLLLFYFWIRYFYSWFVMIFSFVLFIPLFFTFILSANKLLGFMNYSSCPIENYESGFFLILSFTFNSTGNYWGTLFIYMLLDCELILGLFYIFSIKSYNSYLFMLFIFDLFFFDIYFNIIHNSRTQQDIINSPAIRIDSCEDIVR